MQRRDFLLGPVALTNPKAKTPLVVPPDAVALIDRAVSAGEVRAAVLHVTKGQRSESRAFGLAKDPNTVFLLASITKPMTATCVMAMVDRGKLSVDDPVAKHLPEFRGTERSAVTVRHLLTHTSGLPDMLPDNLELRRRHAPLKDFVAGACKVPLLFRPGTELRYQSMGILLAAQIVERLTKVPLRDFLRHELFEPLGMTAASLGLGGRRIADTAPCEVIDEPWGWNSPYWRDLGAPWGGAHGTVDDIARLLRFFARPTTISVLRPRTARAMITKQTGSFKERFGFGWMLACGGSESSEQTFGHLGSTGTMCWHDPTKDLTFVMLTTKPLAQSQSTLLQPVADIVARAFKS